MTIGFLFGESPLMGVAAAQMDRSSVTIEAAEEEAADEPVLMHTRLVAVT
jgi:hypothetical protein